MEISEFDAFEKFGKVIQLRHVQHDGFDDSRGQKTAERLAAFQKIFYFRAFGGRTIKRRFRNHIVSDRNVEAPAKFAQLLFVHFFLLMRDVAAFARFAEAVAFDSFCQNHRRLAFVLDGGFVGRINFFRVVTAAQQFANLLVAQMIHEFEQLGIFAKEMFARVAARLDAIFLIIAVHAFFHALEQQAGSCRAQQFHPNRCPK